MTGTVAFDYIRGYACICVPSRIEAEINNAVKTAKADSEPGSSTSAPKVSVNPQVINIKNSASKTQALEKVRVENIYARIDALTKKQAIAFAGNIPFKDEKSIASYIQAVDPKNLRSTDENIAKQVLKGVVSLTGKTGQSLDEWETSLKKG